jgi:predicted DNA-binding protein (MmcQ/YjbR family)
MGRTQLAEIRRLCLAFPDTAETMTWGQPHFRVRGKIFAGFGDHGGKTTLGFKLEREHADAVVQDPRFERAPYVGAHGWVSMDAAGIRDWNEVRAFLLESYRLIAPRKCWEAFLGGSPGTAPSPKRRAKSPGPARSGKPRRSARAQPIRKATRSRARR